MNIGEIIKSARENLGLTQEDLAEKLEVSRQAVSKWELGASVPSPENLALLEETLGVTFPTAEEPAPQAVQNQKKPFWNWKSITILVLSVLIVSALFSIMMVTLVRERRTDVPRPSEPILTGISFFDENASPLQPDLGDGWHSFTAGSRVLMVVEFRNGSGKSVDAVSLFLTPTGTETFDQRVQLALQAVYDGRNFALFALDIPQDLMGQLDVVLESGGVQTVMETLNVTAAPEFEIPLQETDTLIFERSDVGILVGKEFYNALYVGGPLIEEVDPQEAVWISDDPEIAEVSAGGVVRGMSPGVTTVTAEWNGRTAQCLVRVAEAEEGAE